MNRLGLMLVILLLASQTVWAAHPGTQSEIENLKERIQALERAKGITPGEGQPFSLQALDKRLTFGGLLEMEAFYDKTKGSDATSDLSLSTAQLSTEVAINENIDGHIILLYEETPGDDTIKVDEAVISLHCPKSFLGQSAAFYGGKMYVPFGKFNSGMITDPLTVDLGETQNTAAIFVLEGDLWHLSSGFFSGEIDNSKENIDTLVAALELTPFEGVSLGVSYLSDLAESGAGLVSSSALYTSSVAGASGFVSLGFDSFGLEAEVVTALDDFSNSLIGSTDLTGKRPLALTLEADWKPTAETQLALRYEKAHDFQDDLKRYGMSASYGLFTNTVIALEYLYTDVNTGLDNQKLTGQLAFSF